MIYLGTLGFCCTCTVMIHTFKNLEAEISLAEVYGKLSKQNDEQSFV